MKFNKCPWKWSRVCVTESECDIILNYIDKKINDLSLKNFLEFGCGYSTWFLTQFPWNNYTSVEDWPSTIELASKYMPKLNLVKKWSDIPKIKYDFVFVDSHAGGENVGKFERHKPFQYAIENDLLLPNTIMFAHDHTFVKDGDFSRKSITTGWHGALNKHGWTLIDQIKTKRNLGVYAKS